MNEPPGVASALGIEAVEWLAEGGENLTVRVTGRWRRRRPAWSAQPTLVVDAPGRRYRFPAIAEPPSLSGTGPGMWRISFAVPAALAPELGGRWWLQFGAVIVPLPGAVRPPGASDTEPGEPGPGPETGSGTAAAAPPVDAAAAGPPAGGRPEPESPVSPGPAPVAPEASRTAAGAATGTPAPGSGRAALEADLEQARVEAARLAAVLADQQLARRAAEQGARAERALRTDLDRRLRLRSAEAEQGRQAMARLAETQARVVSLERDLAEARARLRRAESDRASADAARAQAEGKLAAAARERAPGAGQPPPPAQRRHLSLEQQLIARHPGRGRIPAEPLPYIGAPIPAVAAAASGELGAAGSATARAMVAALRQELTGRTLAEAGLRSRLIEAEARLAARELLEQRTGAALGQLREELDGLRADLNREREARRDAERRADRLHTDLGGARTRTQEARQAIAEIRDALESLRGPGPAAPPTGRAGASTDPGAAAGGVQPERLNQALLRLREQVSPQDAPSTPGGSPSEGPADPSAPAVEPAPPSVELAPPPFHPSPLTVGRAWLRPAFRSLARSDPDRAGRLVLDLLPAQRAVYPRPIAYDLELGGDWGCLRVTVRDGSQEIVPSDAPRGPGDVEFRFSGEPADLGRLLRAGRLRRRLGRGRGRVRGRRAGLAALDALLSTQLGLGALYASGVRLEPRTALELLARLVSPAWVQDERFTLAYAAPGEPPVFLIADGHRPLEVTENPPGAPATTTIVGPAGTLELVLGDDQVAPGALAGDRRPVGLLRDWVKRAQSG